MSYLVSRADELADSMLSATWFMAIATGAGALVAATAIIFAFWQIRQTAAQMRIAARRETADSESRTRPYVSAQVVVGIAGSSTFDLVLTNRGRSTARDIKLAPRVGSFGDDPDVPTTLAQALQQMCSTGFDLVPGERRRVFWRLDPIDTELDRGKQPPSVRDVLTLTYAWEPDDISLPLRNYEEKVSIDLTDYAVLIPSPSTGASSVGMNGMEREVRDLAHAVRAGANHVAEQYR